MCMEVGGKFAGKKGRDMLDWVIRIVPSSQEAVSRLDHIPGTFRPNCPARFTIWHGALLSAIDIEEAS